MDYQEKLENHSRQDLLYSFVESSLKSSHNEDILKIEAFTENMKTSESSIGEKLDEYTASSQPSNWLLEEPEKCDDVDSDSSLTSISEEFMYWQQEESIKLRNERFASAQRYYSTIVHNILYSNQQEIINEEELVINSLTQVHIEDEHNRSTFLYEPHSQPINHNPQYKEHSYSCTQASPYDHDTADALPDTLPCTYNKHRIPYTSHYTNDNDLPDTIPYCEDNDIVVADTIYHYKMEAESNDIELPDTLPYESDTDSHSSSGYDADNETLMDDTFQNNEEISISVVNIKCSYFTETNTDEKVHYHSSIDSKCILDQLTAQEYDESDLFDSITEDDILKLDAIAAINGSRI